MYIRFLEMSKKRKMLQACSKGVVSKRFCALSFGYSVTFYNDGGFPLLSWTILIAIDYIQHSRGIAYQHSVLCWTTGHDR